MFENFTLQCSHPFPQVLTYYPIIKTNLAPSKIQSPVQNQTNKILKHGQSVFRSENIHKYTSSIKPRHSCLKLKFFQVSLNRSGTIQ